MPDDLTGLADLQEMHQALDVEFERRPQVPVGLVLLDIKDFKVVNATHGRAQGDEVLKAVGGLVRYHTREVEEVARWDGDMFGIVLPLADSEEAWSTAERVRAALERLRIPCPARGDELRVTARFGVASASAAASDKDGLFKAAEEALRRAKEQGDD